MLGLALAHLPIPSVSCFVPLCFAPRSSGRCHEVTYIPGFAIKIIASPRGALAFVIRYLADFLFSSSSLLSLTFPLGLDAGDTLSKSCISIVELFLTAHMLCPP